MSLSVKVDISPLQMAVFCEQTDQNRGAAQMQRKGLRIAMNRR